MSVYNEMMLDGTKTKYINFVLDGNTDKTTRWVVISNNHNDIIGSIKWYSKWRQYCFFPDGQTIWNIDCLDDIISFIKKLMEFRV